MPRRLEAATLNPATRNFNHAVDALQAHPLFAPLIGRVTILRRSPSQCRADGWAVVVDSAIIHVHPTRRGEPEEWIFVIAHCLLHLAFAHFRSERRPLEWNAACDVVVDRFLAGMKLGRPPEELREEALPGGSEDRLYDLFCLQGIPKHLQSLSIGGGQRLDLYYSKGGQRVADPSVWQASFAFGLRQAVQSAIDVAAGRLATISTPTSAQSAAQRARAWFISSYPLLGAMISAFEIIEDPAICMREGIVVAAVNAHTKEMFINPGIGLKEAECRFVIAHEVLHVGLFHSERCDGRDAYLWNIACDFVVNGWLVEMGLGEVPKIGALYDPELKGLSAESVYDRIVTDMRRFRKLATMRGVGLGEMLGPANGDGHSHSHERDLDDFYRDAISRDLEYHLAEGRGYLPAGLVESIRALSQPAIPWDVELARWFDDWFEPLHKVRSYARPSRRQASTPLIPRPAYVPREGAEDGRTFGVVLDTSGSMDRVLLAKALGAIASYSLTHEVPMVRVVFCDAATYDQGYMSPDAIADRVQIKGRGGTILQPGVDLLEHAVDFPKDGPLLLITDGQCDQVRILRHHAILIPKGGRLPFTARGPVFRLQ
jgi:predicted metal-dependent peptidase